MEPIADGKGAHRGLADMVPTKASDAARGSDARPDPTEPDAYVDKSRLIGLAQFIIDLRRQRESYFESELFAEPAWDIILDLYVSKASGRKVSVSSGCIAASVPSTTALRWINSLHAAGMIVRTVDPKDGRRVFIELSPRTEVKVSELLQQSYRRLHENKT